jgi:hypothetical protein
MALSLTRSGGGPSAEQRSSAGARPIFDANSRDGVARIKSWTYDISVGACSVVRPDGVFAGWANDFAGGANDFAGGANDFAGWANDFAGGANDFAGRVILCA